MSVAIGTLNDEKTSGLSSHPPAQGMFFWGVPPGPRPNPDSSGLWKPYQEPYFHTDEYWLVGEIAWQSRPW